MPWPKRISFQSWKRRKEIHLGHGLYPEASNSVKCEFFYKFEVFTMVNGCRTFRFWGSTVLFVVLLRQRFANVTLRSFRADSKLFRIIRSIPRNQKYDSFIFPFNCTKFSKDRKNEFRRKWPKERNKVNRLTRHHRSREIYDVSVLE